MAEYNIPALDRLIEQFERLPGIGHKSAARIAYHVLTMPEKEAAKLTDAINDARQKIHYCRVCCNLSDKEVCSVCSDENRDRSVICVVESPKDIAAFEKTKEFNATYHVLHGVISPLRGISPDMIRIKELLARLGNDEVKEVFIATNPTVEGEATAVYLSKLIKPMGIKVTRIAYGLSAGADIEYVDEVTLLNAIQGRKEI